MTDEVELIHRRIEEIKANTKDKQFASPYNTGRVDLCNELLSLIDSLQEEPVSEEIGNYNHTAVLEGLGYQSKEEPKDHRKDPQYIQELKDKLDSMSKEEFDKEWDKCKPDGEEPSISAVFNEHWWEMLKKEPVSEDLDKAAEEYVERFYREHNIKPEEFPADKEISIADFKAGANWQEQKDTQKFLHSETATFTREEFTAEMEEVRRQCREQLMKDAADARCFGFQSGEALFSIKLPADKYLVGSEIKVVIIRKDSV